MRRITFRVEFRGLPPRTTAPAGRFDRMRVRCCRFKLPPPRLDADANLSSTGAERTHSFAPKGLLFAFAAAVATITFPAQSNAQQAQLRVQTSRMYRLGIAPSVRTDIRVTGYGSADPVVHVLDQNNVELQQNDDYSPPNRASQVTVDPGSYFIVVRAYETSVGLGMIEQRPTGGSWTTLNASIAIGGRFVFMSPPTGPTYYHAVPASLTDGRTDIFDPVLYLARDVSTPSGIERRIFTYDDDGGVKPASRIGVSGGTSLTHALVGGWDGNGSVSILANDFTTDWDADGLGSALESYLGTCNGTELTGHCSPAPSVWPGVPDPSQSPGFDIALAKDSDHDGITDGDEVLGVKSAKDSADSNMHLHAWGADPNQKDLFVEADWVGSGTPVTESAVQAVAAAFSGGTPDELLTPGRTGIRVHFDVGFSCTSPQLCGAWGGATPITPPPTGEALPSLSPDRAHYFHSALISPGGGGSTPLSMPTIVGSYIGSGADAIAHETGHHLGLGHWGHALWPGSFGTDGINCKPHYRSIMNYAMDPAVGFSHDTSGPLLNPAAVSENALSLDASYLGSAGNFGFPIAGSTGAVDWNRSGAIDSGLLRAGVTTASPDAGCDFAGIMAPTPLHHGPPSSATAAAPALARNGTHIAVFRIADGDIYYRVSPIGDANGNGSCAGDNRFQDQCEQWTMPGWASLGLSNVTAISATRFNQQMVLAFLTADGVVRVSTVQTGGPFLSLSSTTTVLGSVTSDIHIAPLIVNRSTYSASSDIVLALWYVDFGMHSMKHASSITGPWLSHPVVAVGGGALNGGSRTVATSSVPATHGEVAATPSDYSCALVPGVPSVRIADATLYCLDRASDRWTPAAVTSLPSTGRVALQFHAARVASAGSAASPPLATNSPGQFWALVPDIDGTPRLFASSPVSRSAVPSAVSWRNMGRYKNVWNTGWPSSFYEFVGGALYEDTMTSAMRGAQWHSIGTDVDLSWSPSVTGVFDVDLATGNDWHVIEAFVCRTLHGPTPSAWEPFCGRRNRWGY